MQVASGQGSLVRTCLKPVNERKFTLDFARFPGSLNLRKLYILLVSSFVFSFFLGQSEDTWNVLLCKFFSL